LSRYPRHYGNYILLEPIGAGGMSEVDLAHRGVDDTSFMRFAAIKRVARSNLADESFLRMFEDEARINGELHHGNIVQVYEFGKHTDPETKAVEYFIAMEYVPGLDLRALQRASFSRRQPLPLRFSLSVLCEVLRGLQYAHNKVDALGRPMNIVHRDINPRNVMISVRGEVKLIDFGVALAEDRLEKTQGRSLKGKFAYMSPEQIEGNAPLDGRTDVYAVGLMLHELVGGRSPFHGLSELQIMHRILLGQIPPLNISADYPHPEWLLQVHAKALAQKREKRYADAQALMQDLEGLAECIGGLATEEERAELVADLDPAGVEGIWGRLRQYREDSRSVSRVVPAPTRQADDSGTLNLDAETQELPPRPRRASRLLWLLPPLVLALLLALVVGTVGGVASYRLLLGDHEPAPSPQVSSVEQAAPAAGAERAAEQEPQSEQETDELRTDATAASDGSQAREERKTSGTTKEPATTKARPSSGSAKDEPQAGTTASAGGAESAGATGSAQGDEVQDQPGAAQPVQEEAPPAADEGAAEEGAAEAGASEGEEAPAASEQPVTTTGFLNVTSRPKGVDVYVDGVLAGRTPLRSHKVTTGPHRVVIRGPGDQEYAKDVKVLEHQAQTVTHVFEETSADEGDNARHRR